MKIGYICNQSVCVSGASNGIRMQALIWREALIKKGHDVVLINAWGNYDWKTFDIIHTFGYGESTSIFKELKKRGCKIVVSPIIDSIQNTFLYKIATMWGCERLRLTSAGYNLRKLRNQIDLVLARSQHEVSYITNGYGFNPKNVKIVPLSYRSKDEGLSEYEKEPFCLHVSSITQPRKNVLRLIQAAAKYKFKLVLAGSTGSPSAYKPFKEIIDANDNITALGFVTDDQLETLYKRAKVFALPSINEGVGLVALEAAMHGCDVVITNLGGPKEYYSDFAYTVNPYSVDDIGNSIVNALKSTKQPQLKQFISDKYNINTCIDNLIQVYKLLIS